MAFPWLIVLFLEGVITISEQEPRRFTASDPALLWASFLGVGYLKPAPGTWGSVAAVIVWWFLLSPLDVLVQLTIALGYFLTGWWTSSVITQRYGVDDAPQIVADEVVGMWLALALLPPVWWVALLALALFRFLDIYKPSLIGWLDREVKGGLGVMLDDVLAGVVTAALMLLILYGLDVIGITVLPS